MKPIAGRSKAPRPGRAAPARLSLRAFAKLVRVSHPAIRKAIRSGRLRKSVSHDARGPFIADVALARREWAAGATKPANGGGRGHAGVGAAVPVPAVNGVPPGGSLVEAQLRLAAQRSDALELANRRNRGELLEASTVAREQWEAARLLRDRLLNVDARFADVDPAIRARIRAEIREALGDVADELERE